jgi:hypothetical protein
MAPYTEAQLQEAIIAVENGAAKEAAAKQFGIPRSTLRDRLNGARTRIQRDFDQQTLSPDQETMLADWIIVQYGLGCALSHRQITLAAAALLKHSGSKKTLSKMWISKFLSRYPKIKTLTRKRIDSQRVKGVQPDSIKRLFDTLNGPFIKAIRAQNRWNFDETGLQEGHGSNSKVVGASSRADGRRNRHAIVKGGNTRTWVSIIESVNAEGNCIPPVVIFKGASVQAQWFPTKLSEFERWQFTASPNGWTSNDLGLEWLITHFEPLTVPWGKDWRLLVLDGHASHVSDEFLATCAVHRIFLCLLPAHSSHVTQPLDVGVFSSLKHFYRTYLEDFGHEDFTSALSKRHFLASYIQARNRAINRRNILAGWKETGLWPVDIQIVWANPFVIITEPQTPPKAPEEAQELTLAIRTPQGGQELRNLAAKARARHSAFTRAQRDVLSKAARALDTKNVQIMILERKKRALTERIEDLRPKKKTKVVPDVGRRFVQIAQIEAIQQLAEYSDGNRVISDEREEIELSGACIDF